MSKTEAQYTNVIIALLDVCLEKESFLFERPRGITRVFKNTQMCEEMWDAIMDFRKEIVKKLKKSGMKVKNSCVRDKSNVQFEWIPLPAPMLNIAVEGRVIRYRVTVLSRKKYILLSVNRVEAKAQYDFEGIDLNESEKRMVRHVLDIVGHGLFSGTIWVDRRLRRVCSGAAQQETALKDLDAIERLPVPVVFCAVHAILAAVMSEFPAGIKPLYYPALRLSDNEAAESLQLQTLRALMRDLNFTEVKTCMTLWQTEFEVQDTQAIEILRRISHIPLLVRVERDKVQRILSLLMQHARGDAFYGHSDYPLGTLPILIGSTLPPDSLRFTLNWPAFEAPGSGDLAVLRDVAKVIVAQRERFVRCLAWQMTNRTVGVEGFQKIYIMSVYAAIDEILGSETKRPFSHWANGLFAQHEMQQTEQLERFDRAVQLLRDRACWDDVVAPSAKEMGAGSLAFWYKGKMEQHCIAFELKDSFPRFLESRLGMRRADSEEFRSHLKTLGLLEKMSQNVRGQNGKSTAHVLLPVRIWEKTEEHTKEMCDF